MKKCGNCKTKNIDVAIYCTKCSRLLPENDSKDKWRTAFYILAGILLFLFIAPIFAEDYPAAFVNIISTGVTIIGFLFFACLCIMLYFLPTIIAFQRNHHNQLPILLVNLLFGASVIGWIVALIWSTTAINPYLKKA